MATLRKFGPGKRYKLSLLGNKISCNKHAENLKKGNKTYHNLSKKKYNIRIVKLSKKAKKELNTKYNYAVYKREM